MCAVGICDTKSLPSGAGSAEMRVPKPGNSCENAGLFSPTPSKLAARLCLISCLAATSYAANWPQRPVLHAVRVAIPPVIDGNLSEAAWQSAPEFTDFTQHDPDDGKPATMRTTLRIVYDDHAIYFAAKMIDVHPPTAPLFRRDTYAQSDYLSIAIDSQHDRLTGNSFSVAPAGVQADAVLFNDTDDDESWDGVWESATKIVADGWIAEVRIPFSQLRFPDQAEHVWGINVTRKTVRNNEQVRIVNTPKGEAGFVSHFADLVGLQGIHRGRPLEVVPYGVMRSDVLTRADRGDPLIDRRASKGRAGLDLKYALSSNLTLTGTINPDFGQVEVDPAEINLSEFETFYSERRPFFTEGLNLFRFNDSPAQGHFNFIFPPSLFYTRRIGRTPQGRPDADFVAAPSETAILGAAKVTGKLPGGWSIGILDALTSRERARILTGTEFGHQAVEPLTNYFTARVTKQFQDRARVGMILTSVKRRLPGELTALRRSATVGGIDGFLRLGDKSWILEGSAIGSLVEGSAESIERTQRSSSRYYQRPDARHVVYDPTRTSLGGWGGRAMLSRSAGRWRPSIQVQGYSPGLETNDAGFLRRTDIISSSAVVQYVNQTLTKTFRNRQFVTGTWLNHNFDGDRVEQSAFFNGFLLFQNYWRARGGMHVRAGAISDRATRGGPLVRTPPERDYFAGISSDDRKRVSYDLFTSYERSSDGSYGKSLRGGVAWRPSSNLQLQLEPTLRRSHGYNQYVTSLADSTATATFGRRYLFANLEQRTFELGTRADWTLSPRLSFQLFLQPLISSGDYHDYHALAAARTRSYTAYSDYISNDDFNFRSVRGSAVIRWEFRPGSALYVAWNENRAGAATVGDFRFGRDLRAIPSEPSHDVFLVKVSYWLPM